MAKTWRKQSIEEMWHADKLIERTIFLDGAPNMQTLIGLELYAQRHIRELGDD
jgi:bacterioferritin